MKHVRLFLLAAASLAVVACTEAQKDDGFAIACAGVSAADTGFNIYASSGKVSQSVIDVETKAVTGAQAVCSGPRPVDVAGALAAVNAALRAIANATAQARVQATK